MKKRVKIAVITGASSGMGKEFMRQIAGNFLWLDEIWIISRNRKRLEKLKIQSEEVYGQTVIPLSLDLCKDEDIEKLGAYFEERKPFVKFLVNAAGNGQIGEFKELPIKDQKSCTRLNCEALISVTHLCLPYMGEKSRIIQMASASAFVPQHGFAVYAASKAYVLSFSRALRSEVSDKGITVTAVCPGPVDTPFFEGAEKFRTMPEFKKATMADARKVVRKAMLDAERGKELSVYGMSMKLFFAACKLVPHKVILWITRWLERER